MPRRSPPHEAESSFSLNGTQKLIGDGLKHLYEPLDEELPDRLSMLLLHLSQAEPIVRPKKSPEQKAPG